mgnify:CR=1 FL=1
MQDINLDLDKENELVFKLSIVGTKPAKTKSRFLLESTDYSLAFPAKNHEAGEVSISIPPLENILSEGKYTGSLEVIIDDKVFVPMKIETDFKKSVNVVAEVVTHRKQETTISVSPIVTVNKRETVLEAEKSSEKITQDRPQAIDEVSQEPSAKNEKSSSLEARQKIIEERIRKIAGKKNLKIPESKIQDIANFLKNKDVKK